MTASIGVAIVFFNKDQQTIECVRQFSKPGAPVYVLNNGSSETAAQAVKSACSELSNVTYIHSDTNLGPGGGRNRLIQAAKEDWIFFADNDITPLESYWLENLRFHVKHARDIDAILPVVHNIWEGTKIRPVNMSVMNGQAHFGTATSSYTNVFPGGASLINREMFERIGLYDESLFAFEDFEMSLRADRLGCPIAAMHVPDVNLLHDHRVAISSDDRHAVEVRYNLERVGKAHDAVQARYGVSFDKNYKVWLEQQVLEMTNPNWARDRNNVIAESIKVDHNSREQPRKKSRASRLWRRIKSHF